MKIGFIGLGKLGGPCAEVIAHKGYDVCGYDINTQIKLKGVTVTNKLTDLSDSDIVFIAVPTPHDPAYDGKEPTSHLPPKDFDYTIVKRLLITSDRIFHNKLIVLISTVLPGTIRRELQPLVKNNRFIYNPYLIAMGTVAWDMVNPEMIMIGTEDGDETGDAKQLIDFYKSIMENDPRYVVGTWDECECIKIFYNTFISVKLALVNMIQDVAEKQGNINVDVVTNALANSTHRIMSPMYMKAGMGDGGGCHPRDNIALRWMAKNLNLGYDLFDTIMRSREVQAKNLAEKLMTYNLPIVILGKSYKPGVEYEDGSYSILVASFINNDVCYDTILDEPAVYLLAHPQTMVNFLAGSIVVDPWRQVVCNPEVKVVYYGNTRH